MYEFSRSAGTVSGELGAAVVEQLGMLQSAVGYVQQLKGGTLDAEMRDAVFNALCERIEAAHRREQRIHSLAGELDDAMKCGQRK